MQVARRSVATGERVNVYAGAIYLAPADAGKLAYATLYGSTRDRMAATFVLDATK